MDSLSHNQGENNSSNQAWLFDVDGVITNPVKKTITEPEILDELLKRLQRNEIIGLNTGRAIEFVKAQVLKPLEDKVEDKNLLDNIIAVGEKGGVWITYVNGERAEEIDPEIKVPDELREKIHTLVDFEHSKTMFYDVSKRTMITVEMKKGVSLETYHEDQEILAKKIQNILNEMNLTELKIDTSTIAIDIENSHVGKALGAQKFLKILKEKNKLPGYITAFGDSNSDLEMIPPLRESGISTKFVFVGITSHEEREDIVTTENDFDKGTIEYLKKN